MAEIVISITPVKPTATGYLSLLLDPRIEIKRKVITASKTAEVVEALIALAAEVPFASVGHARVITGRKPNGFGDLGTFKFFGDREVHPVLAAEKA